MQGTAQPGLSQVPYGPKGSAAAAAAAAAGADVVMPLLRGKRVLLVEPCRVVRCVLALALRGWGCLVCAVASEAEAVQRLVTNRTLHLTATSAAAIMAEAAAALMTEAAAAGFCGGAGVGSTAGTAAAAFGDSSSSSSSGGGVLYLSHAPHVNEKKFCCSGPYDCVLLDMHHTRLVVTCACDVIFPMMCRHLCIMHHLCISRWWNLIVGYKRQVEIRQASIRVLDSSWWKCAASFMYD
jgi:CheY-like chemotaxis protein